MNEGKKAEDKGKEEDVEEISKAGEGWDRNVIIPEEKTRGRGLAEKEWCIASIEEGRNRYGAGVDYVGQNIHWTARQTGTQASCTGDVVRQIGGHSTRGG